MLLGALGAACAEGFDEELGLSTIGFGKTALHESFFRELQRPELSMMKESDVIKEAAIGQISCQHVVKVF